MNTLITTKEIIISNKNGCTLPNYMGNNSVSFVADVPKSAKIDHIKVDSVFLEDIKVKKHITYHKELTEKVNGKECRVIATVEFPKEIPELYEKLAEFVVQHFEVYYHLEAVVETD